MLDAVHVYVVLSLLTQVVNRLQVLKLVNGKLYELLNVVDDDDRSVLDWHSVPWLDPTKILRTQSVRRT